MLNFAVRVHFFAMSLSLVVLGGIHPFNSAFAAENEIIAAMPENWPPHYSVDENGEPTGFAVEILNKLTRDAGLSVRYVTTPNFPEALNMVLEGRADVIPNLGITPLRKEQYLITDPVETFTVNLFVRTNSTNINSIEDMKGREIGVVVRNIGVRIVESMPDVTAKVYEDSRTALFELLAGYVDAVIYPETVFKNLARQIDAEDRIKSVRPPLREIKRGIAVSKLRPDIFNALNPRVRSFVGTREYETIYKRWFGANSVKWTSNQVIWAVLAALFLGFGSVFIWHYMASVRMNRKLQTMVEDLKQTEAHLVEARDEAERASKAKSNFLAEMSHEFRTPLNAILGFSDILRKQMMGPLGSESYQEYADDIHNSGKHMLSLVDDVLDFSSIEAERREYRKEPILLVDELCKVLKNFEPTCQRKSISLRADVPENFPSFLADKRSFAQIMQNLISNAVKYTNDNGDILVSARAGNDEVTITVSDSGIGIANDKLDQITEPFTQTHSDPMLAESGSGLGLSITKHLIDAHGGTIAFKSELNHGTTVTVTLPFS